MNVTFTPLKSQILIIKSWQTEVEAINLNANNQLTKRKADYESDGFAYIMTKQR